MKEQFLIFLFLLLFASGVPAQIQEARKIEEFGVLPCGDSLSRLHLIYTESQNLPDSKIYVIYYGGRYRKKYLWDEKVRNYNKIQLEYSHFEDGLDRAKSIPLYLTTEKGIPLEVRNSLKDRIILINGGYQESINMEVWLVPNGSEPPKPNPTVNEKDIKFRKDKPLGTPIFTKCYEGL